MSTYPPQPNLCVFCGQIATNKTRLHMAAQALGLGGRVKHTYAVLPTCKEHHKKIGSASTRESLGAMVGAMAGVGTLIGIIASSHHQTGCIAFTAVLGVLGIVMAVVSLNAHSELTPYQDKVRAIWRERPPAMDRHR
jgi:Flp pilus assembly protein TadB